MSEMTFEQGMEELERLVRGLEAGEMSLEESFQAFERGIHLEKALKKMLEEGDAKIRVLTEEGERALRGEEQE